MPRKEQNIKREEFKEIKETLNNENKLLLDKAPPIIKDVGGSISRLPVQTPAYKKWLEEKRKFNKLIGSEYIEPAPELGTHMVMVDSKITEASEEQLNEDSATEIYNPESSSEDYIIPEEQPALREDNTDKIMIDFHIVENTTKKLLGNAVDNIEKSALDELRKYHDDKDYIPEIDIQECVKNSEIRLLQNNKEIYKKQLPE